MVTHIQHGLLVFTDVSPSEQLDLKSNSKICFTSIVCDNEIGVKDLVQFKIGSWKQKLKRAQIMMRAIENGIVSIHAFSLTARQKTILPWAIETLNEARAAIGANWKEDAKTFLWNGNEYPRSQALGIGAYASVLSIVGLRVAIWLAQMKLNKATLVLDNLPFVSSNGMSLMLQLIQNSSCAELWAKNCQRANANFVVTNLGNYTDVAGNTHPAKNHPHFIIADWLAASLRAMHDPHSFMGKESPRPVSEVAAIAKIWQVLASKGRAEERDLDDPVLFTSVKKHMQMAKSRGDT